MVQNFKCETNETRGNQNMLNICNTDKSPFESITLGLMVNSGSFGKVYGGMGKLDGGKKIPVAVKIMTKGNVAFWNR